MATLQDTEKLLRWPIIIIIIMIIITITIIINIIILLNVKLMGTYSQWAKVAANN